MTIIFLEFIYRSIYVLLLYASLSAIFYMTFGLQLEYYSSYFNNHYQAIDFCFESYAWQWLDCKESTMTQLFSVFDEADLDVSSQKYKEGAIRVNLHQSKSWNYLSLALVMYFNSLVFHMDNFLWHVLRLYQFMYIIWQGCVFILPGLIRWNRPYWLVWMHMLLIGALGPKILLYAYSHIFELMIEPLDSELYTQDKRTRIQ